MLHIIRALLQQGMEAGMAMERHEQSECSATLLLSDPEPAYPSTS